MLFLRNNNDFLNLFDGFDNKCAFMTTDIKEEENQYVLIMDVPGVAKENINISVENGYLTINVVKDENHDSNGKNYICRERNYESNSRSFYVGDISMESIKAKLADGNLTVLIPKAQEVESKKFISIE